MKYTIGKKVFGKYFVQDSSGRDLFFLRRKFPLFWRYRFIDANGVEIFSIKRKMFSFAYEVYELKKGNSVYAKVIKEPSFNLVFQTIQSVVNKDLNGVIIAKIEKEDGTIIEVNAKNLLQMKYQMDFIKGGEVIAKSVKIWGLKGITKLYDVEIADEQDDSLILASLIVMEIISRGNSSRSSSRSGMRIGGRR